jgi:hypothetical protein
MRFTATAPSGAPLVWLMRSVGSHLSSRHRSHCPGDRRWSRRAGRQLGVAAHRAHPCSPRSTAGAGLPARRTQPSCFAHAWDSSSSEAPSRHHPAVAHLALDVTSPCRRRRAFLSHTGVPGGTRPSPRCRTRGCPPGCNPPLLGKHSPSKQTQSGGRRGPRHTCSAPRLQFLQRRHGTGPVQTTETSSNSVLAWFTENLPWRCGSWEWEHSGPRE